MTTYRITSDLYGGIGREVTGEGLTAMVAEMRETGGEDADIIEVSTDCPVCGKFPIAVLIDGEGEIIAWDITHVGCACG